MIVKLENIRIKNIMKKITYQNEHESLIIISVSNCNRVLCPTKVRMRCYFKFHSEKLLP